MAKSRSRIRNIPRVDSAAIETSIEGVSKRPVLASSMNPLSTSR